MHRRLLTIFVIGLVFMMSGALEPRRASAGQKNPPAAGSLVRHAIPGPLAGNTTGVVTGQVISADRGPLAFARLRLRSMDDGTIVARTFSDQLGEFSFQISGRGNYLVEVFDDSGRVLAAGEVLTIQAGEAVETVVMMPARLPSLGGLFGNSAGAILSAAAGAGISTVIATGQPVSPEK